MNRETYKIIGILSCSITLFISVLYIINSFNSLEFSQSLFFLAFLKILNISAYFFILFSASQLIKEFSPVNIDKLTYAYLGIEVLFLLSSYLMKSLVPVSYFSAIFAILYIALFSILATIAINILKVKKSEININSFKVFILSYLIILFLLNTTAWFLAKNSFTFNIEVSEINNILSKINYINIIPIFFALFFFIKQIQSKEHINNLNS